MIISKVELESRLAQVRNEVMQLRRDQILTEEACAHDWEKWEKPVEADIQNHHYSMGMATQFNQAYKGLSQLRVCKKCNFAQRHVI